MEGVFNIPPMPEITATNSRFLVIDETGADLAERLRRIAPEILPKLTS